MESREYGLHGFGNHSSTVPETVDAGNQFYPTSHGRHFTEPRSLVTKYDVDQLLESIDRMSPRMVSGVEGKPASKEGDMVARDVSDASKWL